VNGLQHDALVHFLISLSRYSALSLLKKAFTKFWWSCN